MVMPRLMECGEGAFEGRWRGSDVRVEISEAGRDQTVVSVRVEHGRAQAEIGDAIGQPAGNARNQTVVAESAQIVGDPARGI